MRRYIKIHGIVQGVGFRPFVYNAASRYNIKGYVINTANGVFIDAESDKQSINGFISEIKNNPPELSDISKIEIEKRPGLGYKDFEIRMSRDEGGFIPVSPDMATCDDCLKELFDEKDRRYRYPFINCTNCGPRYTIIKDIPYDRPLTTMGKFKMCDSCEREYKDPSNRRFHAQPDACADCGPQLIWEGAGMLQGEQALQKCEDYIRRGKIVAIKGLGGFHLACDARNEQAVLALRERKRRYGKPFAIMVKDADAAGTLSEIDSGERALLKSRRRPIVLLKEKPGVLAHSVCPGLDSVGIMLPYTPLHHLLLRDLDIPLVMTSGNVSDEPIASDNEEAAERLKGIADGFLMHNRDIYARIDDSVFMYEGGAVPVRRARGYAPMPIIADNFADCRQILAVGAQDKVTACFLKAGYFFLTQHIGDLDNAMAYKYFKDVIARYEKLFRIAPEVVAYDMHPGYITTDYAGSIEGKLHVAVQHHHAHIASCMAENGIEDKVIGIAYDGTGYGDDGRIWGAEFLLADLEGYERLAHLRYVPMAGGSLAIKKIYRIALSYMFTSGDIYNEFIDKINSKEYKAIKWQWDRRINCPEVSSMGRLFDAVSALTGLREEAGYEGQAASELEAIATPGSTHESYDFVIYDEEGMDIIDPSPILKEAVLDVKNGMELCIVSTKFHNTVIKFTLAETDAIRKKTGINKVALSGGVFQNRFLLRGIRLGLESQGFEVYTHHKVPPNDGGLSFGQAAIAALKTRR